MTKQELTLVNLTKDYHTGKLGFGILRDSWCEQKDTYMNQLCVWMIGDCDRTHGATLTGLYILEGLCDQHYAHVFQ